MIGATVLSKLLQMISIKLIGQLQTTQKKYLITNAKRQSDDLEEEDILLFLQLKYRFPTDHLNLMVYQVLF